MELGGCKSRINFSITKNHILQYHKFAEETYLCSCSWIRMTEDKTIAMMPEITTADYSEEIRARGGGDCSRQGSD